MTPERPAVKPNAYHGCGDGSCVLGRPRGLQTNGGCHCLDGLSPDDRRRVRYGIGAIRGERDAALALNAELQAKCERAERLRNVERERFKAERIAFEEADADLTRVTAERDALHRVMDEHDAVARKLITERDALRMPREIAAVVRDALSYYANTWAETSGATIAARKALAWLAKHGAAP